MTEQHDWRSYPLPDFITDPNPDIYLEDGYVTVDFETTTEDFGSALNPENRLVLACWAVGKQGMIKHKFGGEFEQQELLEDIEKAPFIVAHNAKFELQWLARCGVDLHKVVVYDTMIGEYVIAGNRRWALALDAVAERRLGTHKMGVVSRMIKAGIPVTDIPPEWLLEYCIRDVALTRAIFRMQLLELEQKELMHLQYARCLLTPVLADVEKNGMQLDPDLIRIKHKELEAERAKLDTRLTLFVGGRNPNSPPQMADFLYDELKFKELTDRRGKPKRTATGRRLANAPALEKLKATNKVQRSFLDLYQSHRSVSQELSKYMTKWLACVEENNGVLKGQFNQTNTMTHRLSSTGAKYRTQLQNMPRSYKRFFKSGIDGWLVGECDGAQLEFRVAAHLGRDPVALHDIETGTDVHSVTAGIVGVSRQEAKAHTFKPLYGGQSGTEKEVEYYKYFRDRYKGITEAQQRWIDTVLSSKELRTEYGLIFYWPNTRMDMSGYVTNTTSICNYPVQGFATAEIIPLALVYMWHLIHAADLQMFLVNTVHDSIIAELPPEETEAFRSLARYCLIDALYPALERLYGIKLTVPLGCGVKIDTHWGTGEETKYEARPELYKEATE